MLNRILFVCVLLAFAACAMGDTIRLADGRTLQGRIVARTSESVTIDAMVGGARARITVQSAEISEIDEGDVPDGFFDGPKPSKKSDRADAEELPGNAYLEVPLAGSFGREIQVKGLARVFRYAEHNGIQHIVLVFDSAGGEISAAGEVCDLMRRYRERLLFHGILRDCRGVAIAPAALCHSLSVVPGVIIGQTEGMDVASAGVEGAEAEEVYRAELGHQLVSVLRNYGREGEVAQAMVDPAIQLAAWIDQSSSVRRGAYLPADVSPENIIFSCASGELLTLDHDQAVRMGIPTFNGDPAGLGEMLELEGFERESTFGADAMQEASRDARQREANADARFEAQVRTNMEKREKAQRYLERNVQRAAQWDPEQGEYERYASTFSWGWGWGTSSSTDWTRDSRNEWRNRTDTTMAALSEAAKAARSLQRLDREAVKLGLEPSYADGELAWMIRDLAAKYDYLGRMRNRRAR